MLCTIFLFGLSLVAGMPNDDKHKGNGFLHGSLTCCNKDIAVPFHDLNNDFTECFKVPKELPSCDVDICIANKLGFASSDGTIDKKALAERVENDFENDPDLANVIKEKCVNGDISKYGKEDFCDLIKVGLCLEVQTIVSCDDWNDKGICKRIKESAQELIKKIQ